MKFHGAIREDFNNIYILEYWEVEYSGADLIEKRSKTFIKKFKSREEAKKFARENNINLPENR